MSEHSSVEPVSVDSRVSKMETQLTAYSEQAKAAMNLTLAVIGIVTIFNGFSYWGNNQRILDAQESQREYFTIMEQRLSILSLQMSNSVEDTTNSLWSHHKATSNTLMSTLTSMLTTESDVLIKDATARQHTLSNNLAQTVDAHQTALVKELDERFKSARGQLTNHMESTFATLSHSIEQTIEDRSRRLEHSVLASKGMIDVVRAGRAVTDRNLALALRLFMSGLIPLVEANATNEFDHYFRQMVERCDKVSKKQFAKQLKDGAESHLLELTSLLERKAENDRVVGRYAWHITVLQQWRSRWLDP